MNQKFKTEQEEFRLDTYAKEYVKKNQSLDKALGVQAWKLMPDQARDVDSLLECGCNIGRNLLFLNEILPQTPKSIIEIAKPAFDFVTSECALESAFNGSIVESDFDSETFDLVFSMGVLIHIHSDHLLANMEKMFSYSKKYILMGEYFNRTPVMLEYQGQRN